MKSTLTINNPKKQTIKFPIMARSKKDDNEKIVVLFTDKNTGMVINAGKDANHPIGYYSKDWNDITYDFVWYILPESSTVCITQ